MGLFSRCRLGGLTLLLTLFLEEIGEVGLGGFFVAHSFGVFEALGARRECSRLALFQ